MGLVDKLLGKKVSYGETEGEETAPKKKKVLEPSDHGTPGPMEHVRDDPRRIAEDLKKVTLKVEAKNEISNSSKKTAKKR